MLSRALAEARRETIALMRQRKELERELQQRESQAQETISVQNQLQQWKAAEQEYLARQREAEQGNAALRQDIAKAQQKLEAVEQQLHKARTDKADDDKRAHLEEINRKLHARNKDLEAKARSDSQRLDMLEQKIAQLSLRPASEG